MSNTFADDVAAYISVNASIYWPALRPLLLQIPPSDRIGSARHMN